VALRVVVGEDNYLVREGLRRLLETRSEVEVVATCPDLESLNAAVDSLSPDVVVTDIRMPPDGVDEGVRFAAALRERAPQIGVVILSQYAEPDFVLELLREGAAGRAYLLKERLHDVDELIAAICAVADGGSTIDARVVETLVAQRAARESSPLNELTAREREILAEMATGKSNHAIAASLYLAEASIEKYITSIFAKLGLTVEHDVHRRVRAVLMHLSDRKYGGPSAPPR
jgi:DNA-binding NarL/FixJ family response regulator